MNKFERVILIILDSLGIGALPDADKYGDTGVNTLNHIIDVAGLKAPNLSHLGLCRLSSHPDVEVIGTWGRMIEQSKGKDTTTGHWEIAGVISDKKFPTYPNGFPNEVIKPLEKSIERKVLWNRPASGTEIIKALGEEHEKTGNIIVYTSADSVFQIAAHEEVVPVEELYEICKKARSILQGEHAVARVIARPFINKKGNYVRTPRRKDFSLPPPKKTILDFLKEGGHQIIGIGKISDIFAGRGITKTIPIEDNSHGMGVTLKEIEKVGEGLVFTNLNDFDTKYGHRRDSAGYRDAIQDFDRFLPSLLQALCERDLIILSADHGNDPTAPGTDHTREYVPLLVYTQGINPIYLGTRKSFADIGATIADNFELHTNVGDSFLDELITK